MAPPKWESHPPPGPATPRVCQSGVPARSRGPPPAHCQFDCPTPGVCRCSARSANPSAPPRPVNRAPQRLLPIPVCRSGSSPGWPPGRNPHTASPRLERVAGMLLRPVGTEPREFIRCAGDPRDRLGQALDACSVGEVSVRPAPEEVVFKLDADDVSGVIGKGWAYAAEQEHYCETQDVHSPPDHRSHRYPPLCDLRSRGEIRRMTGPAP